MSSDQYVISRSSSSDLESAATIPPGCQPADVPNRRGALQALADMTAGRHRTAFRDYEHDLDGVDEETKQKCDEMKRKFFALRHVDLVDKMGLSGMTLLKLDDCAGSSRLPLKIVLPLIALQSWLLQFCILYFMARRVVRLSLEPPVVKDVDFLIIFAAIYLHFTNCMDALTFTLPVVKHHPVLREQISHRMIALPIFIVDGIVIPFVLLIVGALYLCTSACVADVILNSCAVAFVGNIDNWLLELIDKVNHVAGKALHSIDDGLKNVESCTIHLPVNEQLVKFMAWWLCVVPVVPWCFSMGMAYIGMDVLHL